MLQPPAPATGAIRPNNRRCRAFIFIWGSRNIIKVEGVVPQPIVCPSCKQTTQIIGKSYQRHFTFFFIPMSPTGPLTRFTECSRCHAQFRATLDQWRGGVTAANAKPAQPGSMNPPPSTPQPTSSMPQQQNVAPGKGLAITSMILSIVSCVMVCVGPLLSIPAIIMGFVALSRLKKAPPKQGGSGFALTGVLVGFASLLVITPLVLLFCVPVIASTIGRARELANRTYDANEVRQLVEAARIYAADNRGDFPPHIAAMTPQLSSPRLLISKQSTTTPLTTFPTGPWTSFASDIDAHCDFIYIGGDVNISRAADTTGLIVVYEKDLSSDHGRNLGYADGHVEWVNAVDLQSRFDDSNRLRGTMSLPPVAIDGSPPAPAASLALVPRARPMGPRVINPAPVIPAPNGGSPTPVVRPNPAPVVRPPDEPLPPPVPIPAVPVDPVVAALANLKSDDMQKRRVAASDLERAPFDAAQQKQVATALEACLDDPQMRSPALLAMKNWAAKDNVPALLKLLATYTPGDIHTVGDQNNILEALGHTGDVADTADTLAKRLTFIFHRRAAVKALTALGPGAETAVQPYVMNQDWQTAREACRLLGTIGTAQSLPALRAGLGHKVAFVHKDAQEAIRAIEARGGAAATQ